jgi:RND family efflux transporter MFP subunit
MVYSLEAQDIETPEGIDPALWTRFMDSENTGHGQEQAHFHAWLEIQCRLIPDVEKGALFIANSSGSYAPVAFWPEDQDIQELTKMIEPVTEEKCGLISEPEAAGGKQNYLIAYPVSVDEYLPGIVVVKVDVQDEAQLQTSMGYLHWGAAWLELYFRRQQTNQDRELVNKLESSVDLLAKVLSDENVEGASMRLVTELAAKFNCERVSLGFVVRGRAKVRSLSHSAEFSKRMNLIRAIGSAMDEAIDQRQEIIYPSGNDSAIQIQIDHEALAREYGASSILTVPFYLAGEYIGAITLERSGGDVFSADEIEACKSISALAGAAVEEKRLNDRLLIVKIWDALKEQVSRLLGPKYLTRKVIAIGLVLVVLFFTFAESDYRIASDSVLEGSVRRVIASPLSGYIDTANKRAGDRVEQGEILATLDDRDIRLERLKHLSERSQLKKQSQEALAKRDRAKINIINAQIEQVAAQLELVEGQLNRTKITAPFDGLIIDGDLSQKLGSAVQQGDQLFEITPLDSYRVILKVDERRIADMQVGQTGHLALAAFPDEKYPITTQKITPVSTTEDGINYFRVEASLDELSDHIRPGMEGVGKVTIGREKLIYIWTRSLIEWWEMAIWSWIP